MAVATSSEASGGIGRMEVQTIGALGSHGQINIHSTPSMEMPDRQIAIQGDEECCLSLSD